MKQKSKKKKAFTKGVSGNVRGRPKGSKNKVSTALKNLVSENADIEEIIRVFSEMATHRTKKGKAKISHVGYLCGKELLQYSLPKIAQRVQVSADENTSYMITFGGVTKEDE